MKKFPIVILHGWGSEGKFLPLEQSLKHNGFEVFAPDFPGFGTADMPTQPLHLVNYANFLYSYLGKNGIKNPVLIGHSFGGRVALKYQQLYPKDVGAIILSGTPGLSPVKRSKFVFSMIGAKLGGALFSLPPFFFFKDFIRKYYYCLLGVKDYYRATGAMKQTFKNIVEENLHTTMESVRVPCLLIWGEEDALVPLHIAKDMSEIIPGAKLISIVGADHGVPYKKPDIFSDKVIEFLKTL